MAGRENLTTDDGHLVIDDYVSWEQTLGILGENVACHEASYFLYTSAIAGQPLHGSLGFVGTVGVDRPP